MDRTKEHTGGTAQACGLLASTHYVYKSRGLTNFLNLGKQHPHLVFTWLIRGTNRSRLDKPEDKYPHKHACLTRLITVYRGQPDMILRSPKQMKKK